MDVINQVEEYNSKEPVILTIGNFDGIHLGHQAIINRLSERAVKMKNKKVVITFQNHPTEILKPSHPVPWTCTLLHRLKLFEEYGMDTVILLTFSKPLSQLTAAEFLHQVKSSVPFTTLILGHDATIGHDKLGKPTLMHPLAKEMDFELEYLPEIKTSEEKAISSTLLRHAIRAGDFAACETLLGRPYSFYGAITTGQGKGKRIGYPTANFNLEGLCLPPLGVYAVQMKKEGQFLNGVANLGIAPTLRSDNIPILEIHFLDSNEELYGQMAEVFFKAYIRPEKKFQNVDELRQQIAQDIEKARKIFGIE